MEAFFRWPVETIAGYLALAVGVVLLAFMLLGWRAPLLYKLGLRNIGRRPLRAALIVGGLTLSTTVIGSAFATGDAMTHTFHTLVTGSLGTVDEVVVLNPPWRSFRGRIQALTQPGLAQGAAGLGVLRLGYFEQTVVDQVQDGTSASAVIAGVAPAIVDQVTIVHGASQQLQSAVSLLAWEVPPSAMAQRAFGPLETSDGAPVALAALGQDEVLINAAAAESFGVDAPVVAGQSLSILRGDTPWNVQIRAVVKNGGIAGSQPLIIVPLANYQRLTQRQGLINQVLVVNHGGAASVAYSAEAARELRMRFVDRAVAQALHELLSRPDVQRGLGEAEGLLEDRDREQIAALRVAAAQPELTDAFVSLISEPRTRQRLLALAWRLPSSGGQSPYRLLQDVSDLAVLEVKQEALDQAREYGAVVTTVFLVLGLFSIAASILLIVLIFALLAADRSTELTTMRALGMRRWQIVGLFLFEGLVYAGLGALLGALASTIGGYAIVGALGQALAPFGVRLEPHITTTSLVIAGAGGLLLTFGAMLFAAWRVSRVEIVAGTRGEAVDASQRWLYGLGALLLVAAALIWWRWQPTTAAPRHPLVAPSTLSLLLLGLLCGGQPLLGALSGRSYPLRERTLATLTGLMIGALWLRLLLRLPIGRGDVSRSALIATVAGVVLIIMTVWTATQGLGPLLKTLDVALVGWGRMRAIVRPAVGYLGQQRWRTGLTVVMFGMVVCIMVVALTLIDVVISAYAADEPPIAGYELRGDGALGDITAALAEAPAISRDAFTTIGSVARQEAALIQLGLPLARWQDAPLAVVDDGFLEGVRVRLERRASRYSSDAAVWAALREQPGTAVVTGRASSGVVVPPAATGAAFQPLTLWVRLPSGGKPVKLTVVGVVDARSDLDAGIYISQATAQQLDMALPAPQTYFFAVRPDVRLRDAAEGLRISFGAQGLTVSILGEALKLVQAIRLLLVRLVQGFMGLGLVAGIAALGLLGIQSVLERRSQLGALRALGFTRGQMRAAFSFEVSVIAALGIAVGMALGLILARSLIAVLASGYPELRFVIPWPQIALTVSLAWIGALGAILLGAWQAGRIAPADALRAV